MSAVAVAIGVGSLVSGYMASKSQAAAAGSAAGAQTAAAGASVDESRRQFDAMRQLLSPYAASGLSALTEQQNMLGLGGPEAQTAAIKALQEGPQMQALTQQGENAIMQNAAATGGLRGGNTQAALAQFRPQMLSQLIQQRYENLGGLTQIGQASAAGTGAAGMQTGQNIAQQYGQMGAAQAGAAMALGQAQANMWGGVGQTASALGMMKLMGKF